MSSNLNVDNSKVRNYYGKIRGKIFHQEKKKGNEIQLGQMQYINLVTEHSHQRKVST